MKATLLLLCLALSFTILAASPPAPPASDAAHDARGAKDGAAAGATKEKLLVFDCEPPGSDEAAKSLKTLYDVEVVKLIPPKSDSKETRDKALRDTVRKALQKEGAGYRLVMLMCHAKAEDGKALKLWWEKKAHADESYRFPAEDFRKEVSDVMADRPNPVLFFVTCEAGALKRTLPGGKCCFAKDGAICAACPEDCPTNGAQFTSSMLAAKKACDEKEKDNPDTNGDGKVTVGELQKWFAAEQKRRTVLKDKTVGTINGEANERIKKAEGARDTARKKLEKLLDGDKLGDGDKKTLKSALAELTSAEADAVKRPGDIEEWAPKLELVAKSSLRDIEKILFDLYDGGRSTWALRREAFRAAGAFQREKSKDKDDKDRSLKKALSDSLSARRTALSDARELTYSEQSRAHALVDGLDSLLEMAEAIASLVVEKDDAARMVGLIEFADRLSRTPFFLTDDGKDNVVFYCKVK